jgi:hypothetical protein
MTVPVYLWIVVHGDADERSTEFFASTSDEPPESMLEFAVGSFQVTELAPEDVATIARVWAEAQLP